MKNRLIVIDPGHGGKDRGATRAGLLEKDVVLDIGQRLCRMQTFHTGTTCIMTRYADHFVTLGGRVETERWAVANLGDQKSTVFVSIHVNSSGADSTTASGLAVFHHHKSSDGAELAREILSGILDATEGTDLDTYNAGVIPDRDFLGHSLYVLRRTASPACLVELGFINNPRDRKMLKDSNFRQSVAAGIWDGVQSFFDGE